MRVTPDGFRLTFTKPVDPATAREPAAYRMERYTYKYHPSYGSPEVNKKRLTVEAVDIGTDRRSVRLRVDGRKRGYVHELHADGLRAADGASLRHPDAYYTLNRIPRPDDEGP